MENDFRGASFDKPKIDLTPNTSYKRWRFFYLLINILMILSISLTFIFFVWEALRLIIAEPSGNDGGMFITPIALFTVLPFVLIMFFLKTINKVIKEYPIQGQWIKLNVLSIISGLLFLPTSYFIGYFINSYIFYLAVLIYIVQIVTIIIRPKNQDNLKETHSV